jgi:RNA polymerase sigma-70 factor (ECF subfamily)
MLAQDRPRTRARVERQLDPQRLGDHVDRLYRAAWALCGSRTDAEDLVQDTFERVLRRPRFLRRDTDDVGYLLRVLRNTYLTRRRDAGRRPRETAIPEERELPETRTGADPEAALEAGAVYRAIAALSDDHRDVLVAVDVAGLSYHEAAKALGVPEGTIMSRLYRARQGVVRSVDGPPGAGPARGRAARRHSSAPEA